MIERKELKNLVFINLNDNSLSANELYDRIRTNNPAILNQEQVRGFRSFVQIINSFDNIMVIRKEIREYKIKR